MQLIMSSLLSRPLPSSKNYNFQNEAFCDNEFHLHQNIKSFSYFALSLALKQRLGETRKWPSHFFSIKFQHYAILAVYFFS